MVSRGQKMKAISISVFVTIMTATSLLAWGESCPYSAGKTVSTCEAGYVWDEQAQACVANPMS